MKTLNELLKEIGYNDSPLRKEVINAFKEWLQQNHKEWKEKIQYEEMYIEEVIPRLLEELKQ